MIEVEFKSEMQKLIERFGNKAYTEQFTKILWKEVSVLPRNAFAYMIEKAIGEFRQAPLLPEFRAMHSEYRENLARSEKIKYKQEAKDFYSQRKITNEQERWVSNEIISSLTIKNLTERRQKLKKVMDFLNKISPSECKSCDDTGVIYNFNGEQAYQCFCKYKNNSYPTRQEYESQKEFIPGDAYEEV